METRISIKKEYNIVWNSILRKNIMELCYPSYKSRNTFTNCLKTKIAIKKEFNVV